MKGFGVNFQQTLIQKVANIFLMSFVKSNTYKNGMPLT